MFYLVPSVRWKTDSKTSQGSLVGAQNQFSLSLPPINFMQNTKKETRKNQDRSRWRALVVKCTEKSQHVNVSIVINTAVLFPPWGLEGVTDVLKPPQSDSDLLGGRNQSAGFWGREHMKVHTADSKSISKRSLPLRMDVNVVSLLLSLYLLPLSGHS